MSIKIKSPTFPESVADGTVANWLKKEGEEVNQDDVIAEIETDKVVLEVLAQSDGVITKIIKLEGEIVSSAEVIGEFSETEPKENSATLSNVNKKKTIQKEPKKDKKIDTSDPKKIGPAAKKIISEENIDPKNITPSGKDQRITKADVINHLDSNEKKSDDIASEALTLGSDRPEKRVPMSRLRSTIAKRLVSVKQDTAMLTTFNEVDMLPIKELRSKYGAEFKEEHGVKLGFMGFFVAASINALKKIPTSLMVAIIEPPGII